MLFGQNTTFNEMMRKLTEIYDFLMPFSDFFKKMFSINLS